MMIVTTTTSKKLLSSLLVTLSLSTPIFADEIVLDGTLGGPARALRGPDFAIEAQMGQQIGNNLFHSFDTFNLKQGKTATFSAPETIANIISRVTGGQRSSIDGTLRSAIPADMYFLNPAGVMFGEHARLEVQGSLYISTADYLRLGTDGRFAATHPENTLLSVAPPSAFGFLDATPAPISKHQSILEVQNEKTLSFIGGDLTIKDEYSAGQEHSILNAPNGQINLVSVAAAGEFPVVPTEISANTIKRFGTIKITDVPLTGANYQREKANIDVSGTGGGNIYIRGGQIVMENVYVWADTNGKENGQGITINADDFVAEQARITTVVTKYGTGKGGNIDIAARKVALKDGAQIATTTRGSGNSGKLTINAEESVEISGFFDDDGKIKINRSGLLSNASSTGNGGQIFVKTSALILTNDSTISSHTSNTGNAGDISLQVDTLTLTEGAQIDLNANNKFNTNIGDGDKFGDGGKLTINAKDSVLISGKIDERRSALVSNTKTNGNGGEIILSALRLAIEDNGTIQAGTEGNGQGGKISLDVGKLDIRQGGTITAESQAQGNAGHIFLRVSDWLRMQTGSIMTKTDGADGGNISITSPGYLYLTDGEITTSVAAKYGDGGNITLNPKFIVLDDSKIIAQAASGDGGNININTTGLYDFSASIIDASSKFGLNGRVSINSPEIDISGDLLVLPKNILGGANLLNNRCASLSKENLSRFIITIRDVMPPGPEDLRTHTLFK